MVQNIKLYSADWIVVSADLVLKDHILAVKEGRVLSCFPRQELEFFLRSNPGALPPSIKSGILFPGFINAHMHQYGVYAHGIPSGKAPGDFESFLKDYWWPLVEDRLRLEQITLSARYSASEMIRSGITGFCDTLEAPLAEPGILIEQAKAVETTGLRAVLSLESSERISLENGRRCLAENEALIRWARANSLSVEGFVCTHTSFSCSLEFMEDAAALADTLGTSWQFHLSESRYEPDYALSHWGCSPAERYARAGLLSPRVLASQCVKVTPEEIGILSAHGVRAVHMPVSNCEVGGGFAPVPAMLAKGMNVALGTDGYDNNFLNVMKMAFLVHKSVAESPLVMPARDVFRMATEGGAGVLGWNDAGTLEVGKSADFVCMTGALPTPVSEENIFDQIVVYAREEYISHVYRGGEALMEAGRLTRLDQTALAGEVRESAAKFWRELE